MVERHRSLLDFAAAGSAWQQPGESRSTRGVRPLRLRDEDAPTAYEPSDEEDDVAEQPAENVVPAGNVAAARRESTATLANPK